MPSLSYSRSPVLYVGPPPAVSGTPPTTLWAYYFDAATGTNGTVRVYEFSVDGTPVGVVDSVACPTPAALNFSRAGLLRYSVPNPDGVLTLWDENGQLHGSWLWTPNGSLSFLSWTGARVRNFPVLANDGWWYWLEHLGSGSFQLWRSGADYVGSTVGSSGTAAGAGDEYTHVWLAGGYYCVSNVLQVPLAGHGGGPLPSASGSLDPNAKRVGIPDEVTSIQPIESSTEATWVRRVDETGAQVSTAWPTASPWGRVTGQDVIASVQVWNEYYVAMAQDTLPAASPLRVVIGHKDATESDTPDYDLSLGEHPTISGLYPALVMAVA